MVTDIIKVADGGDDYFLDIRDETQYEDDEGDLFLDKFGVLSGFHLEDIEDITYSPDEDECDDIDYWD